ncbi:MAG: hypothetical protein K2Q03_10325 [Sphingobacteriaceae bacterium]|nr:hypothetical protein [Sphingobacteriaceae bacterium]
MKRFIKRLVEFIKGLFKNLSKEYKQALSVAVYVVDGLYNLVDNPVADVVTAITPTSVDDRVVMWLRDKLPTFLKQFKLFAEVADLTEPEEIIKKVSEILHTLSPADKNGERLKIAVALAIEITEDGKLDWADAVKIIQALKDKSI